MSAKVVKTDGTFEHPEVEREILAGIGAEYLELDRPSAEELVDVARDADALMVLSTAVPRALLEELPGLRVISRYGVGVDAIDLEAATAMGVAVAYVPDYCVDEVSSHAVALLLSVWRKLGVLAAHAADGAFPAMAAARPVRRLAGSVVGLVGFGALGQAVARKLSGFDLSVVATDPGVPEQVFADHGVERLEMEELLRRADVVSVHTALTKDTFHLIGPDQLAQMKRGAVLVNTARGGVVDQAALTRALQDGHLGGAGLDVLETEPPDPKEPLLHLPNVLVTPHVGAYSEEAMSLLQARAATAVVDVLGDRRPMHLANPEVWERRRR